MFFSLDFTRRGFHGNKPSVGNLLNGGVAGLIRRHSTDVELANLRQNPVGSVQRNAIYSLG